MTISGPPNAQRGFRKMSVKSAAPRKRKQPFGVYMRRYWPLYAMLLLPTAFCLLFKYWPMTGLVMAFKNFKMMRGIWGSAWNGLDNFNYLFSRAESVSVILQTLKLNLFDLLFGFSMPIILSLLLNEVRSKAFKRITQTVIYLPHFLSWVIIASLFIMLLRTETGMINIIAANMGGNKVPYLEDNFLWQVVYIFIGVWQSMGWGTIIYLAAITGISAELYEAATVDGAGRFAKIWHVTLPGIRGTIVTLLIMNLGRILGSSFERVNSLSNPYVVLKSANVISTYIYRVGLANGKYHYATAMGLFQNVIGIILILISDRVAKSMGESGLI